MKNRIASQPRTFQQKRIIRSSNRDSTTDKTFIQVSKLTPNQTKTQKNLTLSITSPKIISPFTRDPKIYRPSIIELLIAKQKTPNSKIRTPVTLKTLNLSRPGTVLTPQAHHYEANSKTPINFCIIEERAKESPKISYLKKNESLNQLENFILGCEIGKGAYAVVRSGKNVENNAKVAVKIYDKGKLNSDSKLKNVEREIRILGKMNHPNIVKLFKTIENKNSLNLVMEFVGGCSLLVYLKGKEDRKVCEGEARRIFRQILMALEYCHRMNITHRDIKLENILIDHNQNIKIIDFGFSTCFPNEKKFRLFCGTPSYMSPEIVQKQESHGPPSDIWAAGVVLYVLTTGTFPFKANHSSELYQKIQKGTYLIPSALSPDLLHLLTSMLSLDPQKRPTASDCLNAQWFKEKTMKKTQSISEKFKEVPQITVNLNNTFDQGKVFRSNINTN